MQFDIEIQKQKYEIETGDIFITDDNRIRMVIIDEGIFNVVDLEGKVSYEWFNNINILLENYNIKEFYKNKDLKIVKKEK